MNDKFEKFTERARKVLSLAQEEAQRFNHNYIGTEHLLLGLVREGDGVAAKVLANLGVELQKVRSAVEFIIGRGDRIVLGEIGLTPRSKKVIELAVDEARRLNHHYIGTEHLLLGLVREGEGIAAGVLESLGINLEKVRIETIRILGLPVPESTGLADTGWIVRSSIGPRAISRESRALSTTLLVGAALLLGVGVTTMANNIAYGMPAQHWPRYTHDVSAAGRSLSASGGGYAAGDASTAPTRDRLHPGWCLRAVVDRGEHPGSSAHRERRIALP